MTHLSITKKYSFFASKPTVYDCYFYGKLIYYNVVDYGNIFIGKCEVTTNSTLDGRYVTREYAEITKKVRDTTPIKNISENFFESKVIICSINDVDTISNLVDNFFVLCDQKTAKSLNKKYKNILNGNYSDIYELTAKIYEYVINA